MSTHQALLISAQTGQDPYHPKVTIELLTALLAESALDVAAARSAADVTPAALARADLIVLWELVGEGAAEAYRPLLNSVSRGKPLLALHTAIWGTTHEQVDPGFLGGEFKSHPPFQTFTVHVADAPHAITEGVADFDIEDEAYQVEPRGDLDLLAWFAGPEIADPGNQAEWLQAHPRAPLLYTKPYGEGRIVVLALGHDDRAIGHPAYRRITAQAVRWLLGS
ncbi:MAG: ThuA domain-containing protein [Armatimonadetes bacterium]|nr:ThuA domain-containing protein [Armatimonadota bacterium]